MNISVELTLTPIQDDYEPAIINFIKSLRNSGLTVKENPLSTQIFGNYDALMPFLTEAIKRSFEDVDISVLTMKVVKTNRSDYEPNF